MKVAIIIPAYNEGSVIDNVVGGVHNVFSKTKYSYEVVVVNDKSTDNTAQRAKRATVISHLINQGAGGATSTGLAYAEQNNFDWVVTMDGDGQHDPNDALKCLEQAIKSRTDLLIGSRLMDKKGMSRVKLLGNKGLSLITKLLFGVNVTDSQSGLRVFSRKALDTLEWKSTSYDFCSEMIWRAKQANLKIAEYPIKAIYTDYSRAKGQNNWNAINIVGMLIYRRFVEYLG
jgi:glycosyltransferase involved in cell wall biosynthesis